MWRRVKPGLAQDDHDRFVFLEELRFSLDIYTVKLHVYVTMRVGLEIESLALC